MSAAAWAQVEPLQGVVPAHGHVTVAVTFQPLLLSTQTMEFEVRVAGPQLTLTLALTPRKVG